jgi:hypothetical protein
LQSETGFEFDGNALGETLEQIGHRVTKAGDTIRKGADFFLQIRDARDCGRLGRLFASCVYYGGLWIFGLRTYDGVYLSVRRMLVADEDVDRTNNILLKIWYCPRSQIGHSHQQLLSTCQAKQAF